MGEIHDSQELRGGIGRGDSLILSTIYGETSHSALPTFRLSASCSGTRCTVREPTTGYSDSLTISDRESANAPAEAVGSKHGITLQWQRNSEFTAFGAWLNHSGFAIQSETDSIDGIRVIGRYGLVGGDLTGAAGEVPSAGLSALVGTVSRLAPAVMGGLRDHDGAGRGCAAIPASTG